MGKKNAANRRGNNNPGKDNPAVSANEDKKPGAGQVIKLNKSFEEETLGLSPAPNKEKAFHTPENHPSAPTDETHEQEVKQENGDKQAQDDEEWEMVEGVVETNSQEDQELVEVSLVLKEPSAENPLGNSQGLNA